MFKKNKAGSIKTNLSGSNKLLTLTVSSSRALAIQILPVSGLAHELCSRLVTITVRPGGISPTWQKQNPLH